MEGYVDESLKLKLKTDVETNSSNGQVVNAAMVVFATMP